MSSRKYNNWAILADFSPYRYEDNEGSHFPTKKPRNQSIRVQITFEIQMQTFPLKFNTRKLQSKTWNTVDKTHSNNGGNYTHQWKEVEEEL